MILITVGGVLRSVEKKPAAIAAADTLKSKIDLGAHVAISPKLRITRGGDLLIKAGRGQTIPPELFEAVVVSIGGHRMAKKLQERTFVEILDIDPTASMDVIISDLIKENGDPSVKTGKILVARGGMAKVSTSMASEAAKKIMAQKFKIG